MNIVKAHRACVAAAVVVTMQLTFPPGSAASAGSATSATTNPAPASGAPKYKNVPAYLLDEQKLSGEDPHLPDALKRRYARSAGVDGIKGAYMVLVGRDGRVAQVDVFTSIPGADEAIVDTIKRWTFKPQTVPIRSLLTFVYSFHRDGP